MVWIYFSWAIALLGAQVAYAHQTLAALPARGARRAGRPGGAREHRARRRARDRPTRSGTARRPWDEEALSEHLDVPLRTVRDVIAQLEKGGIVAPLADVTRSGVWQLGRPADRVRVIDVVEALRGPRETPLGPRALAAQVEGVFAEIDQRDREASGATLEELVEERSARPIRAGAWKTAPTAARVASSPEGRGLAACASTSITTPRRRSATRSPRRWAARCATASATRRACTPRARPRAPRSSARASRSRRWSARTPDEIVFTAGATEANNTALRGAWPRAAAGARARDDDGRAPLGRRAGRRARGAAAAR